MKTYQDIIARVKSFKADDDDFLGFKSEALLSFLPYDEAVVFLPKPKDKEAEDRQRAEWDRELTPLTRAAVIDVMASYMRFAWEKVEDHRGISASRSVEKMRAWAWLLDDQELIEAMAAAQYENYGAPILKVVCDRLGFPIPTDDRVQLMIMGLPCSDGCSGCGH